MSLQNGLLGFVQQGPGRRILPFVAQIVDDDSVEYRHAYPYEKDTHEIPSQWFARRKDDSGRASRWVGDA